MRRSWSATRGATVRPDRDPIAAAVGDLPGAIERIGDVGEMAGSSASVLSQASRAERRRGGRAERVVFEAMALISRCRDQSSGLANITALVTTGGIPSRRAAASTACRSLPGRSSA